MRMTRWARGLAAFGLLATALGVAASGPAPAGASSAAVTKSNTAAISIPDSGNANPYPSTINVAGLGAQIEKLTVTLKNVTHSCVRDLDILLVGPTGQKTTLLSDAGDSAFDIPDFTCNDINTTVVMDDSGPSLGLNVPGGNPITVRPSDNDALGHQGDNWSGVGSDFPANNLSTFNGTNPNGAWKLYVVDDSSSDSGAISGGWSVTITTTNGAPTGDAQVLNVNKGVAKAITLTGTDPESDVLTCQPGLGATATGKGVVAGSGCNVTYTANTRSSGVDSFTFTVRDSANQTSAKASILLAIQNRAPVADTIALSLPAGESVVIPLGGTDPDPGEGLALTCTPTTGETNLAKGTVVGKGCTATYKAKADSLGVDSFTYSVADGFGGTDTGTVTVNIGPKSLPGCTDADSQNARYVCRVYLDTLGRAAEPGGKAYWVGRLNAGDSRSLIARQYLGTPEFRKILVNSLYTSYLGRPADSGGLSTWSEKLRKGANPDEIRSSLLGSTEFWTKAGKSADGFAAALYQKVVRRPALADERAAVAAAIKKGTSRITISGNLLKGSEADTITVAEIYERFLRRSPPPAETTYWVDRLRAGASEITLYRQVIGSAEYYAKA